MSDTTATPITVYEMNTTPEIYLRVNITKNTKGYNAETTASVRTTGSEAAACELLSNLLASADTIARTEIAARERVDADEGGSR